jgi:Zn-dependent protease with chaperone function
MNDLYPLGPRDVPAELTRPTNVYKHRAWLAMASLTLFVVLYLALAGWFVWTAYRMLGEAIGGSDGFLPFLTGVSAAFLAIFMLKALFFVQRGGEPDAIEVTPAEQPRLFEFLHRLADEAGAPRPNRVYLSARVNAAVFYDLSILNLLFPSRKNLEIGLALVNVLTLSEIKAVLAHEFGHFAQRSMAIGSWVYIAQQIAAHVIARRDALDKFLRGLSSMDVRIAWIGWLLSLIVWSIRSLMDTLFRVVVLAQRALSRQMEFQADLVAVSLTGSDELVHALHKLHAADEGWDRTLRFAGSQLQKGRVPHDLFAVHTRTIETVGRILNDDDYGKVPAVISKKPDERRVFKSSFAQPPQMWSTHPANADRESNAKRHYLASPHDKRSAWLLFDNVEAVKAKVQEHLLGDVKGERASPEETLQALDEQFSLRCYESQYRGVYLGRPLTREVARPEELYESVLDHAEVRKALSALYPDELPDHLQRLRELIEERVALQALREKVYRATGGRIVHRGREISRVELPAAIRQVMAEEKQVRQAIVAHDRQCRSVHLAAAAGLGGGWKEYLAGLIGVLHYAEHTLADLQDMHGLLGNVVAVVTADGKVSKKELKRLVAVANNLHGVFAHIHEQKSSVALDESLRKRLDLTAWSDALEEFKLPPATDDNINDWMNAIDGWVNATAAALGALESSALEQLLLVESDIARHTHAGTIPEPAPAPSAIPAKYPTLLVGRERERQKRLDWWSRFQTADGLGPLIARLLVAGAIVAAVLGTSAGVATTSSVSVHNGLGVATSVRVGGRLVHVAPFSSSTIEIELAPGMAIEARTAGGELIERFEPAIGLRTQHYVYNVASAAPLVEWPAEYGSAVKQEPRFLGAPRWTTSSVDVFFAEPPQSIQTKGGGGTRWVLTGLGDQPEEAAKLFKSEDELSRAAMAHAKWDDPSLPTTAQWQALVTQ